MTHDRYGYYRYGRHDYEPSERDPRGEDRPKDTISPREAFGAGIALASADDEDAIAWDFVVDSSGDLASTEGYDELGKDIAFSTAREASNLLGMLGTPRDIAELETTMERIANQDPRLFSAEARVRSGGRGARFRGHGDDLDPSPDLIDVELETAIAPDLARKLGFYLPR